MKTSKNAAKFCFFIWAISCTYCYNVFGQSVNLTLPIVNGDISYQPGSIDVLLYDKPFRLNMRVTDDVVAGEFSYTLKENKNKSFLIEKFNQSASPISAEASNKILSFKCDGINPNREYTFTFTLFLK